MNDAILKNPKPRHVHELERAREIVAAMASWLDNGVSPPPVWADELRDLLGSLARVDRIAGGVASTPPPPRSLVTPELADTATRMKRMQES